MAAGEGRRLRPFTERWPKPVLPIDGRPVIATLLRDLAAAGFTLLSVVTGHLAEQVESILGDGSGFGVEIRYARQPRADGSADAIATALAAGALPPFVLSAADTVYTAGDVLAFRRAWDAGGGAGAIAAREGFTPSPDKPGIVFEGGRVVRVHDYDTSHRLTSAPVWGLGPELQPYLEGLPGPPFELKDAYQRAIDDGLAIDGVEIGPTRDLTHPLDLVHHNFTYLRGR